MRGVRDELSLGELAPLLLAEVVEDDQNGVPFRLRGYPDECHRPLLVGAHVRLSECAVAREETGREVSQREGRPRLG